jgi:hypothetical protein
MTTTPPPVVTADAVLRTANGVNENQKILGRDAAYAATQEWGWEELEDFFSLMSRRFETDDGNDTKTVEKVKGLCKQAADAIAQHMKDTKAGATDPDSDD